MLDFGFYNMDCMKGMKEFPDKFFDLAIVDPPYGGGFTEGGGCQGWFSKYHQNGNTGGRRHFVNGRRKKNSTYKEFKEKSAHIKNKIIGWDIAPTKEYFEELFRVSKNQIIWGGNYFTLPPSRCFLIWRKLSISDNFSMAMAEYAWASFNENAKVFEKAPQDPQRFHPTQKPVELYTWILNNYAKPGDTILDTHVGSASSLIACERMGFQYVGFEIDEEYYNRALERLTNEKNQIKWDI